MKKIYSFVTSALAVVLVFVAGAGAWAQAPAWQTAVSSSVSANNDAYVLGTTAANGNVYVVGAFSGTASFGNSTLVSSGQEDGFVAKWNPVSGDFVWAQKIGGSYGDGAAAVAVNGANVYVTGAFRSQPAAFGSLSLTSAGTSDFYLAKLTDAGTTASFTWVQQAGGSQFELGEALAVSGANVYVAGYYGDATFGTTVLPTGSAANLFVAKLVDAGPSGAFVWAKAAGGSGFNDVHALAVSGTSVYLAGFFSRTATFGATTLTSAGSYDAVVAKLEDAGATADFAWAQRGGGPGEDRARGIALNGSSVYVTGSFEGSAATFGPATLSSAGLADVFVTKLTDAGTTSSFGWVERVGGAGADRAYALAGAGTGICIVGEFNSRTLAFGTTVLTAASNYGTDLFVARLTDAGRTAGFAWAQRAGGTASVSCSAVAVAPNGTVYVGAGVQPPASFGSLPIAGLVGTTVATLASLTDPTLTATTAALRPENIGLFPNPAHGRATLQLPAGAGLVTITVLDALGRSVHSQTTTDAKAELNLAGLEPGFYALRVQAGGATATRRLMVE
ncbi:T9SS type A sorting domain-containing protein [Hymenobacter properus]|uniref:T9SS type A sorting domain-containing protein n=1 Tax=Hymenobacter properus TaxID=2791026 RepID=A0A931FI67_9BACT|nr:T9SS type A sorting domain-containing protein [Hymenobacter properus]MBF9141732.1 T9SS type A sorting domain-containing protein [Hymenobacter properus]MBR7720541.1 T9SS type A sorting domain-containing protein [Microvirga sp. SRT04]